MKTKTLKSIFFFLLPSVLFLQKADAQIVYTDLNPDVVTSGSYNLDVNIDGTPDFTIMQTTSTTSHNCFPGGNPPNPCTGTRTNRYLKVQAATGNMLLSGTLTANTVVYQNAATWTTAKTIASSVYQCSCNIFSNPGWYLVNSSSTGGYIGLKFVASGQTYYGWLRFYATASPMSCTLFEFGYNSSAGKRILTSQTASVKYVFVSQMGSTLCAGGTINVPYTLVGNFDASNIVTAQLSDAAGSFTTPVNIGSTVSNASGTINAAIPASIPTGTAYRIRITTSNPVKLSSDINTTTNNGLNLIVNASIPSNVITTSGSTNICNGNVVITTSTASGNSYQWKLNGNSISGATTSGCTATTPGDYTCMKTNGCGSITSNIITVTSTPVAVTITSGATTTCGTNVSLSTAYGAGNTYQWKLNGNNITNATSYSYSAPQSGDYTCVKTNSCGSVTSNTITVTINPLPAAVTITAATSTIACSGPVVLSGPATSGVTYQWYFNSVTIAGATTETYSGNASGSYYLKETNSYGCTRNSNSLSLLLGNPVATVSPTSGSICQGNPVPLYAYPSGTSYSYQWQKNGNDISGVTTQSYSATHAGIYTARVTIISGGCSNTSAGAVITHCARTSDNNSNIDDSYSFIIVPNPVTSSADISFLLPTTQKISLKLFDMSGRAVKIIADGIVEEGETSIELDASDLNAGIYLLRMNTGTYSVTKKISITK